MNIDAHEIPGRPGARKIVAIAMTPAFPNEELVRAVVRRFDRDWTVAVICGENAGGADDPPTPAAWIEAECTGRGQSVDIFSSREADAVLAQAEDVVCFWDGRDAAVARVIGLANCLGLRLTVYTPKGAMHWTRDDVAQDVARAASIAPVDTLPAGGAEVAA